MKKSLFAKLLILVLCLSMVLCGCSNVADPGDNNNVNNQAPATPEEIADKALDKTLSAIFNANGTVGQLGKNLDCGKMTISVGEYLNNELYFDTNKMNMANELKLNIAEGMEIEAGIYLDNGNFVMTVPALIEGAYGVNLPTILDDAKDSALLEMMGISYDDMMTGIGDFLAELEGMTEDADSAPEGLEEAVEKALANIDEKVTEGKATVDGKEVNAIIATYTLDSEGILDMMDVLGTWFVDYIEKNVSSEDLDLGDFEDAMTEAEEALSEADIKAELVVNINAETGYIMTVSGELEVTAEEETGAFTLDIDLGVNAAESNKYTLKVGTVTDGEAMDMLQLILKRDITDTDATYELTAKTAGVEVARFTLEYDKATYAYQMTLGLDEQEYIAKGIYKVTDKSFELTLDTVSAEGEELPINAKTLLEKVSADSIPAAPEYKNILKMSQDELTTLFSGLGELMGGFSGDAEYDEDFDVDFDDSYMDWEDDEYYTDWEDFDF